jgi:hypothetical protein
LVAALRSQGEISPAPIGGDRRSGPIEAHRDYLLGLIRRQPDMTLLEIQERLIATCGERFSSSVIWRFFDRHRMTFKKSLRMPRSSSAPDVLKKRQEWFGAQLHLDPRKLVFIDETGASTNLTRKGGRFRRGRSRASAFPADIKNRHAGRKSAHFRSGGAEGFRRAAQCGHVRRMGEEMSRADTLERRHRHHGQSVEHKRAEGRATHQGRRRGVAISAALQSRYEPHVEKAYSKLKAFLRTSSLMNALETLRRYLQACRMRNYFKTCGYDTD